ncbi:DUF1707 SHOCT-like domain-containing protein [Brevibacterium yomogidense]|uniref:DUF1707 SHOCT-like domain-containing protein n=1 Tax=Brevibacterium yomogidense TaxID=946573 RepID=UPI0018DF9AB6|nr:DUF1707 domain-containing protein [Brevibacterium yomogidense]
MSIPRPSERPSFGQRDAYRDVLSEGYAQGRLNDEEFRRRSDEAAAATSLRRLEELIADLPRGDLPVPAAQIRGPARRNAATAEQTSAARRMLLLVAALLVGSLGGFLAGSAALHARAADTVDTDTRAVGTGEADGREADTDADGAEADTDEGNPRAGAHGDIGYGDAMRAAELAAGQDEMSRLTLSDSSASAHVPTAAGTTYDIVSIDEDGSVSTDPGGTYGESENGRFDASVVDPDLFAAMVLAAPDVYAQTTGSTALAAARLDLHVPVAGLEYAGVEPGDPVVSVQLGVDEYGSGGGTVVWSTDGTRILEVIE